MYVQIFFYLLSANVANAIDGYSAVMELLNHRWTDSCSNGLNPRTARSFLNLPEAIGPCQSHLEVIHLPPTYHPNWLLNANCASDCYKKRCFSEFTMTYCQQVPYSVPVIDHKGDIVTYKVSIGCVCRGIPRLHVNNKPDNLVS